MASGPEVGRRRLFVLTAGALVSSVAPVHALPRPVESRALSFRHLHTGEILDTTYWADGRYQPDALRRINLLLRDFRTGAVRPIDRRLLDLLVALRRRLATYAPVQVISGYRSPATNAALARRSEGVAHNSEHLEGCAIDIRLPDRPLAAVHRTALALAAGGVGYYPRDNFIHLDTGPVRRW